MTHETRNKGRKKSLFPTVTTVPAGSFMDVFSGGINSKITFDNFVAGLGVTGTLVQDGDPLGTPVLDTQGTVNNIRNLEDGPGVKSSVSPENGVTLEHNFVAGSGGVPVFVNETEDQPIIRSLAAGDGIALAGTNGSVRITATEVNTGNNIIVVNSPADFPTAVGGLRTLGPDLIYILSGDIDVGSDHFMLLDNTTFRGNSAFVDTIISTTVIELFSATEGSTVAINDISINCPNAGIMHHTSTTPRTGLVSMDSVIVQDCDHIGDFTNTNIITYSTMTFVNIATTGMSFAGSLTAFNLDTILVQDFSGVLMDLNSSTFDVVDVENTTIFSDNGANIVIDGLPNSGNINLGGHGGLRAINIIGDFTSTGNILPSDLRWDFQLNNQFPDSVNRAYLAMPSNATVTTISAANTPVLVSGTWSSIQASRFVNTAAGRMTYIGTRTIAATVTLTATAQKQGAGTESYRVHIAKNGVPDPNAIAEFASDTTRDPNFAITSIIVLDENDFLEIFVECLTDTDDVIITASNFVAAE